MGNFRLKLQIEMDWDGWMDYNKDEVFRVFCECLVTDRHCT